MARRQCGEETVWRGDNEARRQCGEQTVRAVRLGARESGLNVRRICGCDDAVFHSYYYKYYYY